MLQKLILICLIFLSSIYSISFTITNDKDVCFNKTFDSNEALNLSYLVSGDDETSITVTLEDPHGVAIFTKSRSEDSEFKHTVTLSGTYKLCFNSNSSSYNNIAFEWHGDLESGHIFKIAKGEELSEMKKDIISIAAIFQTIENNIKYLIERQTSHTESKIFI